jgi:hypothetical protein
MDYIKFITVIRQLCNSLDIKYDTRLVYNNSTYEIVYSIYLPLLAGETVLAPITMPIND